MSGEAAIMLDTETRPAPEAGPAISVAGEFDDLVARSASVMGAWVPVIDEAGETAQWQATGCWTEIGPLSGELMQVSVIRNEVVRYGNDPVVWWHGEATTAPHGPGGGVGRVRVTLQGGKLWSSASDAMEAMAALVRCDPEARRLRIERKGPGFKAAQRPA